MTDEKDAVEWAVRNDAGKTWRYATARAAGSNRATSEMLVKSTNGGVTWQFVWTGPEAAPEAVLRG